MTTTERVMPTPTESHVRPWRVVVADDSFLIRQAVEQLLAGVTEIEIVGMGRDAEELWQLVVAQRPDVVVTDIRMPPSGDIEGLLIAARLREEFPDIGLVVLSQYADPQYAVKLLASGAEGRAYLLKERIHDRTELITAVDVVARGGSLIDPTIVRRLISSESRRRDSHLNDLTPRERDVLAEMAQGKSNSAIAEALVVTKRAVEKHVGSIFQKLNLEDEEMLSRRVTAVLLFLGARDA